MARKKKWTIPFISLNGTSCRVDIYEEGYTSNTVTELSINNANAPGYASDVPFEFSEDDSNDLTEFIRYKTGFIRLKEVVNGGLSALMPRSITDHYVEAYYGTTLAFTGFMQCQEFDNDWVAEPRELEFPVISPLGLLDAFNFQAPATPGLVTLGSLMNEVLTGLNGGYTDVIYPGDYVYTPWSYVMSSTIVVPFNNDFRHYDSQSNLYSPRDYRYFVEGICACFGWMVHDMPNSMMFAKYDGSTPYSKLTLNGLLTLNSGLSGVQARSSSIDNFYTNADDNALQSVVIPVKKVTLSLEGEEVEKKELNTTFTTRDYLSLWGGGINFRALPLRSVGPIVNGANIGYATFTNGGEISNNGLFPIVYSKVEIGALEVSVSESWVIKYLSSWSNSQPLITVKFFGREPKNGNGECILKIKMERGNSLLDMKARDYDGFSLNLVIKVGSQYLNLSTNTWISSLTFNSIQIDGSKGGVVPNTQFPSGQSIGPYTDYSDIDGIIFEMPYKMNDPIEVSLYKSSATNLNDNDYLRFTELSIDCPSSIDEPYNSYYDNKKEIVVGNNQTGVDEKEITVNFNNYSLHYGEHTFGDRSLGPAGSNPTFPYLFTPMTVLTQKVKRIGTPDFNEYAAKWGYWITGWRWRMIAQSFSLRDDIFEITLARSSSIE